MAGIHKKWPSFRIMLAMLISDLGEFGLINKLSLAIDNGGESRPGLRISIGDDAAAWDAPAGTTVLTTDTMVEGVHFDLAWMGWADLGWKTIAVNLSDVAAMGCAPTYGVVTLGLRGDLDVDDVVAMYGGMAEACKRFGCMVVGGDTVRSPVFFVTVAMQGSTGLADPLLTRGGASPGEAVAVTGAVGSSAAGLRILRGGAGSIDAVTASRLTTAHRRPEPRVAEGRALARAGASAAIDVSDGLLADLTKLCEASGVSAELHTASVPTDLSLKRAFADDRLELAITGGEDYELLFTAPRDVVEWVTAEVDVPITVIGEVTAGGGTVTVLDASGAAFDLDRRGWDHFAGAR